MNFITENVEYVGEIYRTIKRMNFRTLLQQAIQLGLIVTSALTIWKSLILATGSESPVSSDQLHGNSS
jgi:signal peptidase